MIALHATYEDGELRIVFQPPELRESTPVLVIFPDIELYPETGDTTDPSMTGPEPEPRPDANHKKTTCFVRVRFDQGSQLAWVKKSLGDRLRVIGFNASQRQWYRNVKTIPNSEVLEWNVDTHLEPPSISGRHT